MKNKGIRLKVKYSISSACSQGHFIHLMVCGISTFTSSQLPDPVKAVIINWSD